jgi:predicted ATP-dependent endonuclease of OLD family
MRLSRLELVNYRSIEEGEIEFGDMTVLIGKNNSGKSSVLQAIRDIRDYRKSPPNKEWFENRVNNYNKNKKVRVGIDIELDDKERKNLAGDIEKIDEEEFLQSNLFSKFTYVLEVWDDRKSASLISFSNNDNMYINKYSSSKNNSLKMNTDIQPEDISEYLYIEREQIDTKISYEPRQVIPNFLKHKFSNFHDKIKYVAPVRNPNAKSPINIVKTLSPDATELASTLNYLNQNDHNKFTEISSKFTNIMDTAQELRTPMVDNSPNTTIEIKELGGLKGTYLKDLSSGSIEILLLVSECVLAKENSSLLLVEEPELHLHPEAQHEVYNLLRDVSNSGTQVVVTTHSDVFVNRSSADEIVRVERDGTTTLRHVEEGEIEQELADLGYDKSGLLQSEAVVFVEGQSDKRILRQFGKTLDYDFEREGIEIVDLDGEGNMKADGRSLVKLLNAFGVPFLFLKDSHGNDTDEEADELIDAICKRGEGGEFLNKGSVHVWEGYGIEDYLVSNPEAVASVVDAETESVREIISDHENEPDKAKVLDKIFLSELGEEYDKDHHGMMIAKHAESVHDDVESFVGRVKKLAE